MKISLTGDRFEDVVISLAGDRFEDVVISLAGDRFEDGLFEDLIAKPPWIDLMIEDLVYIWH